MEINTDMSETCNSYKCAQSLARKVHTYNVDRFEQKIHKEVDQLHTSDSQYKLSYLYANHSLEIQKHKQLLEIKS